MNVRSILLVLVVAGCSQPRTEGRGVQLPPANAQETGNGREIAGVGALPTVRLYASGQCLECASIEGKLRDKQVSFSRVDLGSRPHIDHPLGNFSATEIPLVRVQTSAGVFWIHGPQWELIDRALSAERSTTTQLIVWHRDRLGALIEESWHKNEIVIHAEKDVQAGSYDEVLRTLEKMIQRSDPSSEITPITTIDFWDEWPQDRDDINRSLEIRNRHSPRFRGGVPVTQISYEVLRQSLYALDEGFLDCVVPQITFMASAEKGTITVVGEKQIGPKYQFGTLHIEENPAAFSRQLIDRAQKEFYDYGGIVKAGPTNRTSLALGLQAIRKVYRNEGYFNMVDQVDTKLDREKGIVSINVVIEKHSICSIGQIKISGVDTATKQKIQQGIGVKSGDRCHETKLERAKEFVEQLVKKEVAISTVFDDVQRTVITVHIEVQLLPTPAPTIG